MRIRLLHSYSGTLTNERRMAEGEHEVTPELGNYLVDNGHAVAVAPVASEPAIAVGGTITSGSWTDVTPDDDDKPDAPVIHAPKRKR